MRKNNKGFTLVELLAALVILGILSVLAMPTVINMLSSSRDKLYVTDAKKLISQAEYKFRVASSEIDKPDDGECLILSMVYLDNSDFDSAPNNGEYVREASYVVVKNDGGNYEFSVELVEEVKKDVYRGVELARDINLNTNSTNHVVSFDPEDLYFVESNTVMGKYNGKQVDTSYINSKLGNSYVSGITKVYNYPDLADSTYNANYAIPKIIRASYVSASNKNFNTLDAILKIVATDVDTPTSDLVVYVGSGKNGKYPSLSADDCDVNAPFDLTEPGKECKYPYGSLSDFSLKLNFADAGYDYSGETASMYIVVVDPEGNTDKLNPSYKIHTNEPPVIDTSKSGVFKRNTDSINLSTAVLKLNVTDDSTPLGELEYCLTENKDATDCEGYQPYSNFVNGELPYTFSCGSECVYDGRTMYLKVFLRDKDPTNYLETSSTFGYNLFSNDQPVITNLELISENLGFVDEDSKALTADVKLTISDSSSAENLRITLAEDADFTQNVISGEELSYANFVSGNVKYTFSGLYDGNERVLHVMVIDEYNAVTKDYVSYGNVHANAKPVVEEINVTSANLLDNVCPKSRICDQYPNRGGAYEASVEIVASDDLVSEDDLKVCISTVESDCSSIDTGNFLPYATGKTKELVFRPLSSTKVFDGDEKTVYVAVYDGYGVSVNGTYDYSEYSYMNTEDYIIYKNHEPEINEDEISIVSSSLDYNFKTVTVSFKVNDDLDDIDDLTYKIYDDSEGEVVEGNVTAKTLDDFTEVSYTFGGDYDGEERTLTIEIYDTYDEYDSVEKTYSIHENEEPTINYVNVVSTADPCTNAACTGQNGLDTKITFSVVDDLDDSYDDMSLCVALNDQDCTEFKKFNEYDGFEVVNGEYVFNYTIVPEDSLPFKGENQDIYLYVKDSYDAYSRKAGMYTLYNNTKAEIDSDYPVVKSTNYEEIEIEITENESYFTNKNPNLSTINFEIKASDEFIDKSELKYQICYTDKIDADITKDENITCLEDNRLYDYGTEDVSKQTVDLEIESYEGQEFFIFAKVYDDYAYSCAIDSSTCSETDDYVSYSSLSYYQVYQDIEPRISKFTIGRPENETSYETLYGTFMVSDPFDTYQVCFSEQGVEETEESGNVNDLNQQYAQMCTDYEPTEFNGDEGDVEREFTYYPTWGSTFDPDKERSFLVYLYVKDSHGNITAASTFPERVPCDTEVDSEGNFVGSGTIQDSIVYELKSGSTAISASRCKNKCYYFDGSTETSNIVAYYKRTITFLDRDDNSIICSKDVENNYEARCSFRDCYYNSSSDDYTVTAIGYVEHENTGDAFVHQVDAENSHVPEYYRYQYLTEYNEDSDYMELHETGELICGKCFDEGLYDDYIITYDNNYSTGEGE